MPLTGDFATLRKLINGLRPEQLRRPIVLGATGVLPRLMAEAIGGRRSPPGNGGAWAPTARAGRDLSALAKSFGVIAGPAGLAVHSDHPGARPLQWGVPGRQVARRYLPVGGLPAAWSGRMVAPGRDALRRALRAE